MKEQSLNSHYFKKVYEANDDPWNFKSSEYETLKYQETLDALPKSRYKNALEIGCSIGILTKLLSGRCDQLLAIDISEKALDQAKEYCSDLGNVTFKQMNFPSEFPDEKFDLIMISEVAYYLSAADWEFAMENLYSNLSEKANVILVHWLPIVHDYPQTGDEVHDQFAKIFSNKMKNVFSTRAEKYRIDVWEKL
ncbi:class I SAM-dependent DNA methyltransferase [Halpernia frigidisoli]|uniref:Nodulation protein S (NodS) n=1 Tax=Halpernia frigidisoli TaxID=1125876 RepID=A0A1I3D125_9FLAO|nr:class I SAM-dependent methyltransferase [Halpernia frigidisoli]SFH80474.1 Nodulation protein S (NodS) [Halpernia frigidisoli]